MLTQQTFRRTLPLRVAAEPNPSSALSSIFSAAIVDSRFCQTLLQDPQRALDHGYLGQDFPLAREERDLIVSIRAGSLAELASQVTRALNAQP